MSSPKPLLPIEMIQQQVAAALAEDIGGGDISAELIDPLERSTARVITREAGVLCGQPWVNEIVAQFDADLAIEWFAADGDQVAANTTLFTVTGLSRGLLTIERTMLNFLQMLSGTATLTARYVARIRPYKTRLLDTRKTIPGLRLAQKYAVHCGGGWNHRIGLFDAYLLKENHLAAAGGIQAAVGEAKTLQPEAKVEVEVETLEELETAIAAGADIALIDNFSIADTEKAVALSDGKIELEASGGIRLEDIEAIAKTGVDYISVGDLTKTIAPLDLSMRIIA